LLKAEKEDRIKEIKEAEGYPIVAVFDIGISDATAIWTVQYAEDKILFLDYYENTNEALPHYI
jgi:hypothetical protein